MLPSFPRRFGFSTMIDFQRKILADSVRNRAFEKALRKVIRKGETTVTDIGSGTGFLSFLAAKLGAKKCYLYEHSGALSLSRKIAHANGIKNCVFVPVHSSAVENPVRTDIVLSETLGNFATEEHIIENLEDGKRFLKPGGMLIPGKLEQCVAPVISDRIMREIDPWNDVGFGLNLSAAREVALHNLYVQTILPKDLLKGKDAMQCWDTIDFSRSLNSVRRGKVTWTFSRGATVYGFAAWWNAKLVPGVALSTSPRAQPTHWEQIFLPLLVPLAVRKDDVLRLRITSDSRWSIGLRVQWEALLLRSGKVSQRIAMDMRKGDLS